MGGRIVVRLPGRVGDLVRNGRGTRASGASSRTTDGFGPSAPDRNARVRGAAGAGSAAAMAALLLAVAGCVSTPSMGRMHPLIPAERAGMTCESALVELSKADQFCEHVREVNDVSCREYAASQAALVLPVVWLGVAVAQADSMAAYREAAAAMKSASVRRAYLEKAYDDLRCGSPPPSRCPALCDTSAPWQAFEAGLWCGDRCVKLSRGERRAHAAVLGATQAD